MAFTRYATANGVLMGETGPNGTMYYDTDALGSVVMTIDQNGAVLNEYRYKPYGGLLTKTGTAPDPKYLWVGSLGFQTSSGSPLISFKSRDYSASTGSWTTTSPNWPASGAYWFSQSQDIPVPVPLTPPTTTVSVTMVGQGGLDRCGTFNVNWSFKLSGKSFNGYLVQKITRVYNNLNCKTKMPQSPITANCQPPHGSNTLVYFEAWSVTGNKVSPSKIDPQTHLPVNDMWGLPSQGDCSYNNITITGEIKLFATIDKTNYGLGNVRCAEDLLSTMKDSKWTSNPFSWTRKLKIAWACCSLAANCKPPVHTKCPPPGTCDGSCADTTVS